MATDSSREAPLTVSTWRRGLLGSVLPGGGAGTITPRYARCVHGADSGLLGEEVSFNLKQTGRRTTQLRRNNFGREKKRVQGDPCGPGGPTYGRKITFIRFGSLRYNRPNHSGPSASGATALISGSTRIMPSAISLIAAGYSPFDAHDP